MGSDRAKSFDRLSLFALRLPLLVWPFCLTLLILPIFGEPAFSEEENPSQPAAEQTPSVQHISDEPAASAPTTPDESATDPVQEPPGLQRIDTTELPAVLKGPAATEESLAIEEPKALLTPVQLIPIEQQDAPDQLGDNRVTPASAPAIRLAPEPLPVEAEAKQITNKVEGIRPASFKDLTPGEATRSDVLEKLGEPKEIIAGGDGDELVFEIGPFPAVRITLIDDLVGSIVIKLAEPTLRPEVVKELNLSDFEPVGIRAPAGQLLGEVYPERGLMFAFEAEGDVQGKTPAPKVAQVILERVSVEPFLLRVEQIPTPQITKRLDTLRIVQQLVPDDAEAYMLSAQIDQQCGRLEAARSAVERALEIEPQRTDYHLLLADLNYQLGHRQESLQMVRAVLTKEDTQTDEAADDLNLSLAHLILGRLLASSPAHDHKQAMEETVKSIKLAAANIKDQPSKRQRQARSLLIRGELSLAEILAYGPWKQRHSVVPQWLASAEKTIKEHVDEDGASRDILLDLYCTSLHSLLILDGQGSPTRIADTAIHLGRELIADSEDLDYQSLIEWKLGTTLWYAARIERQQGNIDESLRLANNAEALMSASTELRPASLESQHHLAQLQFLMGSIHAIYKNDDAAATLWYDKAMPHLGKPYEHGLLDDRGLVGEQLISVGISMWETGRRNNAVSATEEGIALINDAVKAETFKRTALAIPYQNLAQMYRELGNDTAAEKMAQKAADYQAEEKDAEKLR